MAVDRPALTVRGQDELCPLSGTGGNQPGIRGKRPAARIRSSRPCPGLSWPRISAMTCGYQRTSSPVTALPMIMRWISDVPSKIVKFVEGRAVSAGRRPAVRALVGEEIALPREHRPCRPVQLA